MQRHGIIHWSAGQGEDEPGPLSGGFHRIYLLSLGSTSSCSMPLNSYSASKKGLGYGVWEEMAAMPTPTPSSQCLHMYTYVTLDWPVFRIYLSADSQQIYFSIFPMNLCICFSGR